MADGERSLETGTPGNEAGKYEWNARVLKNADCINIITQIHDGRELRFT